MNDKIEESQIQLPQKQKKFKYKAFGLNKLMFVPYVMLSKLIINETNCY